MAIIEHREFTIRTEEHCDAKNTKRHPVQVLDRNGYHYRYCVSIDSAKHHINAWWTWEARTQQA